MGMALWIMWATMPPWAWPSPVRPSSVSMVRKTQG